MLLNTGQADLGQSASALTRTEDATFFSKLTRRSLKRGVFRSVAELERTIAAYINAANRDPEPFVWTASAQTIKAKLGIEPTV